MQTRLMNEQPVEQEKNEEPIETLNFEKPDFIFIPKGVHTYVQQGYFLVCKSCEVQHAIWVGAEKLMVGVTEDGQPILKKRKDI
jgi:hypothetical protein